MNHRSESKVSVNLYIQVAFWLDSAFQAVQCQWREHPTFPIRRSASDSIQARDVVIVGAGIVGLAHAAHAVANGLSVTILERDHHAVGASVRNFGHCCITAQSGELYELAQTSRKYWLEFAALAGFWAAESGAVVLARTEAEMNVLRELSAAREEGQVELLSPAGARSRLGSGAAEPTPDDGGAAVASWPALVGGAFLRDDLRVDPRTTVAKLADWLAGQPGVEHPLEHRRPRLRSALPAGPPSTLPAATSQGKQVFVCVGHDVDYLFPSLAEEHRIERCALQMSRAAQPPGLTIGPAVLTATSMLRYPAFTDMPAAAVLRAEVEQDRPELMEIGANVMFTQRPDGTLILGDSHHYHRTASPFLDETVTTMLNTDIESAIGSHWTSSNAGRESMPPAPCAPILVRETQPGVTVVSVTSGVGMTLSFGLAHRNISRALLTCSSHPVRKRTPMKTKLFTSSALAVAAALALSACGGAAQFRRSPGWKPQAEAATPRAPAVRSSSASNRMRTRQSSRPLTMSWPPRSPRSSTAPSTSRWWRTTPPKSLRCATANWIWASSARSASCSPARRPGAEPLVSFATADKKLSSYSAGIWVAKDSPIKEIGDLKGKSLALGSVGSTSGDVLPRFGLRGVGIADSDLKMDYTGGHPEALLALKNGKVDAAEINTQTLATATAAGTFKQEDFRRIWTSDPIPNDPITVRPDADPAFKKAVKDAFLNLDPADVAKVGAFLDVTPPGPMIEVTKDNYQPLFELAKTMNLTEKNL